MNRLALSLLLLSLTGTLIGCGQPTETSRVELPAGFTGRFYVEYDVAGAPPLTRNGDRWLYAIPSSGHLRTSTSLDEVQVHPLVETTDWVSLDQEVVAGGATLRSVPGSDPLSAGAYGGCASGEGTAGRPYYGCVVGPSPITSPSLPE